LFDGIHKQVKLGNDFQGDHCRVAKSCWVAEDKAHASRHDDLSRVAPRIEQDKVEEERRPGLVLFEQISLVTSRHRSPTGATGGATIVEEDMIAIILNAAPAEHQAVLTSEQRSRGTTLTRAHLEEAMNQHWRQIKSKKVSRENKGEEANLRAIACYEHHETGHKAKKCPQRHQGPGRGQDGRGDDCGGRGQGHARGEGTATIAVNPATEPPHAGRRPRKRTCARKAAQHQEERTLMPMLTVRGDWSSLDGQIRPHFLEQSDILGRSEHLDCRHDGNNACYAAQERLCQQKCSDSLRFNHRQKWKQ
jgi:hypothetical protein